MVDDVTVIAFLVRSPDLSRQEFQSRWSQPDCSEWEQRYGVTRYEQFDTVADANSVRGAMPQFDEQTYDGIALVGLPTSDALEHALRHDLLGALLCADSQLIDLERSCVTVTHDRVLFDPERADVVTIGCLRRRPDLSWEDFDKQWFIHSAQTDLLRSAGLLAGYVQSHLAYPDADATRPELRAGANSVRWATWDGVARGYWRDAHALEAKRELADWLAECSADEELFIDHARSRNQLTRRVIVTVRPVPKIPSFRDPQVLQCPYEAFDAIRETAPVYRHPDVRNIAMVTRYDDVVHVLRDTETFSNDAYAELRSGGMADLPSVREVLATGFPPAAALAQTDGAVHDYHASLIAPFLSPRRLRAMEETVQARVDEVVDPLPFDEAFDVAAQFAEPLSIAVMTDFLGVPIEDRDVFVRGSDGEALLFGSLTDEDALIAGARDYVRLQHYGAAAIADRQANPRDDLITSVATTPPPDGVPESTLPQLVHILKSVFAAGNETTRGALSSAILRLATQPELADLVRSDEAALTNFIEETLRADTPLNMLFRRATRDTEISGAPVAAGEVVAVVYAGANRDPAQFDQPTTFMLGRPSPRRHMSFSYGVHYCLGAPLARLEIKLALRAMLAKFEGFELEPGHTPRYAASFFVHNLKSLHVIGRPRAARA